MPTAPTHMRHGSQIRRLYGFVYFVCRVIGDVTGWSRQEMTCGPTLLSTDLTGSKSGLVRLWICSRHRYEVKTMRGVQLSNVRRQADYPARIVRNPQDTSFPKTRTGAGTHGRPRASCLQMNPFVRDNCVGPLLDSRYVGVV